VFAPWGFSHSSHSIIPRLPSQPSPLLSTTRFERFDQSSPCYMRSSLVSLSAAFPSPPTHNPKGRGVASWSPGIISHASQLSYPGLPRHRAYHRRRRFSVPALNLGGAGPCDKRILMAHPSTRPLYASDYRPEAPLSALAPTRHRHCSRRFSVLPQPHRCPGSPDVSLLYASTFPLQPSLTIARRRCALPSATLAGATCSATPKV